VKTPGEIHQPDNLETTANGSLLIQEDPSTNNQFPFSSADANRTSARTWLLDLDAAQSASNPSIVARIATDAANEQHLGDEGPTDVDPADNPPFAPSAFPLSPGNLGDGRLPLDGPGPYAVGGQRGRRGDRRRRAVRNA